MPMKRIFWFIMIIGAFAPASFGLNFKQVAYIPQGIIWGSGYIQAGDWNRDGYQELVILTIFGSKNNMAFYGYRPYNRYVLLDSSVHRAAPWAAGYLDNDSLYDVLTQSWDEPAANFYINIYEQPDPHSLPTQLAWSWHYQVSGIYASSMYITDLDKDGHPEFLTSDEPVIYVFENRGDDQFVMTYCDTETTNVYVTPYFAIGDFDNDGKMEFVHGSYGYGPNGEKQTLFMRKCVGDDKYQLVWTDTMNEANMLDVITCPDLNGDGKLKFLIGFDTPGTSSWTAGFRLYESMSVNQYACIFSDSITGLSDRGGYSAHSDCGDIDGDGKPELVWATDRTWRVYKYDSLSREFQKVYTAYGGDNGKNATNVTIHDMNGNGYPEIIESGGNETHIWEVEAVELVYPNGGETLYADSSAVIRWQNVDPFKADSFSLFFSSDSGYTYTPIAHGIPGADSTYSWTVNDTVSTRCFIMLWAYQNATGWDFSDAPFTVRRPNGVEASSHVSRLTSHLPLSVTPNPFVSYARTPGYEGERFALYDVSGRKVGVFKGDRIGFNLSAGIYFLKPEGKDAKPLRIVKLR